MANNKLLDLRLGCGCLRTCKQRPNKHMMYIQRCINVDWTSWRRIDADATLSQRCVPAVEDPDQPAYSHNQVRIFAVRLHSIGIFLKIKHNSEDLDLMRCCANWSKASTSVYALRAFLSAGGPIKEDAICPLIYCELIAHVLKRLLEHV